MTSNRAGSGWRRNNVLPKGWEGRGVANGEDEGVRLERFRLEHYWSIRQDSPYEAARHGSEYSSFQIYSAVGCRGAQKNFHRRDGQFFRLHAFDFRLDLCIQTRHKMSGQRFVHRTDSIVQLLDFRRQLTVALNTRCELFGQR